ncbi:prolipoprotein diacylglyceryl transferase [Sporofaciens sp. SGI.106]|uniref:prolipoprotein diacylglyceryl transferase n=1 Tax=Sporofaciens sp. SGI.106 TaxID=3420568 RepID=UPI002A98336D|nr:prolipoprotein diacylglyceryl transferase [Lachnoclostridium sp.]
MHMNIDFPNLGIHLEHVGKTVTVFNFDIAYYGIVIGIGIVAGLAIAMWQARRTGQNPEDYIDLAMYAVIFGIIGARIYYVAFSWDMYKDDFLSILNIREGGLAIYGGVIAAVITVFIFAKWKKLSPFLLLDTAGLGLVTGQMIGRWGNFFNREVFGEYTNSLLAMRLPVDAVRSSDISETMWNHVETVKGVNYIQVHPTFLYESLWCLMVLLLMIIYGRYKKFDGEVFLFYLAGYGAGRFWIEGIRTDQLLLPVVGLPVSQVLSGVLIVVSVVWIILGRRKAGKKQ